MKFLTFILMLITALSGCTSTIPRRSHLSNVCLFTEYLVRGDERTAYSIAAEEESSKYRRIYSLFLPRIRSLDDTFPSYPVFIENRQKRYPTVRQFKRAGFLGEGLDGTIKYVDQDKDPEKAEQERQLMADIIIRENMDREKMISFMLHNSTGLGRKELILGFSCARQALALEGDYIEVRENGETFWKQTRKKLEPIEEKQ